ncbi:hypothetical protein U0070_000900 [Myodes glareolus]|uniref:Uncharacterized protein n=1 Tax=Myodes glareolus TaxID=447135 RepID=A0AAW0I0Z3_MYOGA
MTLDKPQTKHVSRKFLSLPSHKPTAAYPVRPHSHSALPTTHKTSQPAPANISLMASDKPALPNATNATQSLEAWTLQSIISYFNPQGICFFFQEQGPISFQNSNPIPAVRLQPATDFMEEITEEQRPEREAMKRWAQQERENASKCTSLGNHSFSFRGRRIWKLLDIMAVQGGKGDGPGTDTSRQILHLLQSKILLLLHPGLPDVNRVRLLTDPIHSPSEFLALPTATITKKKKQRKTIQMRSSNANLSMPLDPLRTQKHPDTQQTLYFTNTWSPRQKFASDNGSLGSSTFSQDELWGEQSVMGFSLDSDDMTTLGADINLPQCFSSLTVLNQFCDPQKPNPKTS